MTSLTLPWYRPRIGHTHTLILGGITPKVLDLTRHGPWLYMSHGAERDLNWRFESESRGEHPDFHPEGLS